MSKQFSEQEVVITDKFGEIQTLNYFKLGNYISLESQLDEEATDSEVEDSSVENENVSERFYMQCFFNELTNTFRCDQVSVPDNLQHRGYATAMLAKVLEITDYHGDIEVTGPNENSLPWWNYLVKLQPFKNVIVKSFIEYDFEPLMSGAD